MATQVQNRRGTTAEHSTFTGANGELTVDTTKRTLVVHDGATAGGRPLLREDQSNLPTSAPTTGIYNASGSLAISTNGSGRLFVDSSGRVGIGGSPSTALHLGGSSSQTIRINSNTSAGFIGTIGYITQIAANRNPIDGSIVNTGTATAFINLEADVSNGSIRFCTTGTNNADALERMCITSGGLVGVGDTLPDSTVTIKAEAGTTPLKVSGPSSEFLRCDQSGRLLVGTSTARSNYFGATSGEACQLQVEGNDYKTSGASFTSTNNSIAGWGPHIALGRSRGGSIGTNGLVSNGDGTGSIIYHGNDGSSFVQSARIDAFVDGTPGTNDMPGRLVFSTTADGASSPTERMRINNGGSVRIGGTGDPGSIHIIQQPGVAVGTQVLSIAGSQDSIRVYDASNFANPSNAATVLWVRANNSTSRSISAAGTVNTAGTDYAEYMVKSGDFTIAKGDICGITLEGLLTNKYINAVSFVVKSTNPSYVGGDSWGSDFNDDPDGLEAVRQTVDRIAFAGQVPVNAIGATPGQYIVPVEAADGGIEGIAKDEADLTLAEYMRAVGKVIAIEDDGRARIIVKVA